jgi:hypothetical protein
MAKQLDLMTEQLIRRSSHSFVQVRFSSRSTCSARQCTAAGVLRSSAHAATGKQLLSGQPVRVVRSQEYSDRGDVVCLSDSIRRHLCNRAGVNIGGNDTARVIGQLEAAQDLHQIVDLASGGGPAWFKVLLHTQTSKESQDDTG